MVLILYLLIMAIGIIVTKLNLIPKRFNKNLQNLQNYSLYIMLIAMGYKIGSDKKITSQMHLIGLKALVITLFSMIFCLTAVYFVYKKKDNK